MKIVHVTKKYPNALGGDAVVVSNLEKQQKLDGHQVVILTSNCDEITDGQGIYKFGFKDTPAALDNITPKRLASLIMLFFTAFKVFKKERPDAIHTHSVDMAFFISFAARHYHIPIVHTFHIVTFYDEQQSPLRRKTELFFVRGTKPNIITAPNRFDVDMLSKAGLATVRLLPNGVDLSFWKKAGRAAPKKPFTFVAVGRLEEQKGMLYLLQAAHMLKIKNELFRICIVGEGSLEASLKSFVKDMKLSNFVSFLGREKPTEVLKLYQSAYAAVFPSLYETTPLTLLESWGTHLAVIMTPVGLLNGAKSSKNVRLVQTKNPEALAHAMSELLHDDRKRIALATAGHRNVQIYSWKNVSKITDDIYSELVS